MTRAVIWCAVSDPQQAEEGKESLPSQEADGLRAAALLGLDVVAVLKVPGFSREYLTAQECADDMSAAGYTAMQDLLNLMNRRGFDVLICRDADRFGRTQSLISYITEYIVRVMGARIFTTSRGQWVDGTNFRMWAAMSGFAAAQELDTFRARRAIGMKSRIERGLPASNVPFSHTYLRDEKGNPLALILNPIHTRLWDDLFTLFVEQRTPYNKLSRALYEQYGHVNPATGKRWSAHTLPYMLHNPFFWGHSAADFRKADKHISTRGKWAYDESEPPPAGIRIYRNKHAPVYSGERAERMKAELDRRNRLTGSASPRSINPYVGLVFCGVCGFRMAFTRSQTGKHTYIYYRCSTKDRDTVKSDLPMCRNGKLSIRRLNEGVQAFLQAVFADESILTPAENRSHAQHIEAMESEAADLAEQLTSMIHEQTLRKGSARAFYATQIDQMGERLDIVESALSRARREQSASSAQSQARKAKIKSLKGQTVEAIMDLIETDPSQFNQLLSILIKRITYIRDGDPDLTIEV